MLQRLRKMREEGESGFTLIELLVVVLIIAILAAIAIPVFLRQRERGWEAQAQSAVKNAATASESYGTQNNGNYAPLNGEDGVGAADLLVRNGYSPTAGVALTVTADANEYCIEANHDNLGPNWRYHSNVGRPEEAVACALVVP